MGPVVRLLLGLVGAILLLPGVCSLGFMIATAPQFLAGRNLGDASMLVPLWVVGLLVAWGGVVLLRKAIAGSRA